MTETAESPNVVLILTARDKEKYVYKAAESCLAQTYPCHIILSDQFSKDGTFKEMARAVREVTPGANHIVELTHCPVEGKYSMKACNDHFWWAAHQSSEPWIFQCSADDYSLPNRVKTCMEHVAKLESDQKSTGMVCTTMYFEDPDKPGERAMSGFPKSTGYVDAADGLIGLAYGSTIWGMSRKFLDLAGPAKSHTMDVYYGFLAALSEGFYVIADPQHVHVMHSSADNMGFQGKMRAAAPGSDEQHRTNELNRFQLLDLYYDLGVRAMELYPMMKQAHRDSILNMILSQAGGWLTERRNLHERNITPGIL